MWSSNFKKYLHIGFNFYLKENQGFGNSFLLSLFPFYLECDPNFQLMTVVVK